MFKNKLISNKKIHLAKKKIIFMFKFWEKVKFWCQKQKLNIIKIAKEKPVLLMGIIIFLFGVYSFIWGEKIQVNWGLGWDGFKYGQIAQNFIREVFVTRLNAYTLQRIVPSGIVYLILSTLHLPAASVIGVFEIYNLSLLLFDVYLFGLISRELKIGNRGKWLGFLGLFVNFAILKMNFYYPVLTDTSSFTLGMLTLYAFLASKTKYLLATIIIGAFTWPTVAFAGIILYAFPRNSKSLGKSNFNSNTIFALFSAFVVLCGIIYMHFIKKYNSSGGNLTNESLVFFSILAVIVYIFVITKTLFNFNFLTAFKNMISTIMTPSTIKRIIILFIVFSLTRLFIYVYQLSGAKNPDVLRTYLISSIQMPLIFLVSHAAYYGPIVLLMVLMWKKTSKLIMQYGIGLIFLVFCALIFVFESESRGLINLFPILVVFTVKVLDEIKFKPSFYWIFIVLSLLFSKIWLPLNPDLNFYFINFGPWMPESAYIIQGAVALSTGIILYILLKENGANLSVVHKTK